MKGVYSQRHVSVYHVLLYPSFVGLSKIWTTLRLVHACDHVLVQQVSELIIRLIIIVIIVVDKYDYFSTEFQFPNFPYLYGIKCRKSRGK